MNISLNSFCEKSALNRVFMFITRFRARLLTRKEASFSTNLERDGNYLLFRESFNSKHTKGLHWLMLMLLLVLGKGMLDLAKHADN